VKEKGVLFLSPPLFLILFSAFLFPRYTDLPFTFPCIPTHPILVDLPYTCPTDLPYSCLSRETSTYPILVQPTYPIVVQPTYTYLSRETSTYPILVQPTYPIVVFPERRRPTLYLSNRPTL
jgi:hypothetical protein